MNYYASKGWTVFRSNCIADFVAHRDNKRGPTSIHYVKVITEANAESADVSGPQKGAFIQNAMSNAAVPVYAKVTRRQKKDGTAEITVACENINENVLVRLVAPKPVEAKNVAEK